MNFNLNFVAQIYPKGYESANKALRILPCESYFIPLHDFLWSRYIVMKKTHNARPPFIVSFISTGFGSGYSPIAPGTAGAILATLMWLGGYYLLPFDALQLALAAAIFLFTILGVWSSSVAERYWGEDPSRVVVDEMVGVWIPLIVVPEGNLWYALAALILFRFFDIVKPLGVRKMEKLGGGLGIMMDDILAGTYSALLLVAAHFIIV